MGNRNQFHTGAERTAEPKVVQAVLRDADDDGNAVVRAHLGESPGGVAGRLDDQDPLFAGVHAGEDGIRLRLLEGTGAHLGADPGIPPRERDIQVLQAQELGQALGLIRHRGAGLPQRSLDGHPIRVAVDAVLVVARRETFIVIDSPDQGGGPAFGIAHRPALVLEFAAIADIHQMVLGRFESHIVSGFSFPSVYRSTISARSRTGRSA